MGLTAVKYNVAWLVRALCGRRNPLCRPVDRLAAAISVVLLAFALLAMAAAVPFGTRLYDHLSAEATQAAATTHQVTATVLTAPQPAITTSDGNQPYAQGSAVVQWTAADGPHSATINVPLDSLPGQPVTVWTDRAGQLAPAPATANTVAWSTMFLTLGALLVTLLVCAWLIMATQRLARQYGQRAWGREWDAMQQWGSWLQR